MKAISAIVLLAMLCSPALAQESALADREEAGDDLQSSALMTITNVTSVGADEFIEIANFKNTTQSFKDLRLIADGSKSVLLPGFSLEPGQRIRIHFGTGQSNETDLFLASNVTQDDVSGNLTLEDPATGIVEGFMTYWTAEPAHDKARELEYRG
ncbi:MAG TPA: hypothetical protein PKY93_08375 [Methanothrix sp.]|nr:hypothetical protein [Methanothrix sp.]HQI68706.1 hypothetical protein [Methanothrix sp.]HRS85667.1 hypothetical protein [Methanothrix sp.]